ncbi:MAG: HAD-IA family hydrolase, partial [Chloroflexi bacterium]|nr:HAD-IA family hydrolase [Chloroflexota bacterium]
TIDALGIRKYMDVILISEKVGIRKPDRRIFDMALAQLGVSASEAMFVGDNPDSDIRGAMQAGIAAVWLSDGKAWAGSDSPTHIIRHFHQLEDVLSL